MNRWTLPFLGLVLSAAACLPVKKAQAGIIYVVAPTANATVEGDSAQNSLFSRTSRTYQTAYAQSQLAGVALGSQITGLTYRADGPFNSGTFPTAARTFAQYDIQLSQSNFAPGSLSGTFANNIGSDEVLEAVANWLFRQTASPTMGQ